MAKSPAAKERSDKQAMGADGRPLLSTRAEAEWQQVVTHEFIEEDGLVINKDGSLAFLFRMELLPLQQQTVDQHRQASEVFAKSLTALPTGAVVQKIDAYWQEQFEADTFGKPFFKQRKLEHFFERSLQLHRAYLAVIFPRPKAPKIDSRNTVFASFKNLMPNPLDGIEERIEVARQRVNQFLTSLRELPSVGYHPLSAIEIEQALYDYFNLTPGQSSDSLIKSFSNTRNGLTIGNEQVAIITINNHGGEIESSKIYEQYGGVPMPFTAPLAFEQSYPHLVTQTIEVLDTDAVLDRVESATVRIGGMAGFFGSRQKNEVQAQETAEYARWVRAENHALVNYSLHVTIWDADKRVLQDRTNRILGAMRMMNGAQGFVESFDTGNLFFSSALGAGHQVYRRTLLLNQQAGCYFGFYTGFKTESGLLLCDRNGSPVEFDEWVPNLQSRNALVIGPTGSGKSFTVNNLTVQRHELGYLQDIIDVGGSYKGICQVLGGNYFEYDPKNPMQFNPFDLPRGDKGYLLDEDKTNLLVQLLTALWKDTPRGESMNKSEQSVMAEQIARYYQHEFTEWNKSGAPTRPKPRFKRFWEFVNAVNEQRRHDPIWQRQMGYCDLDNFLLVTSKFYDGPYHAVLDADRDIDLVDAQLNVFDMAGVKEDATLYPVVVLLLLDLIMQRIRLKPQHRKVLLMDEAWSMLSGELGDFVMFLYRTIRKHNGSVMIITQGVTELVTSSVGKPIINNTAVKWVLNHREAQASIPDVVRELGLNDHDEAMIRGLRDLGRSRDFFLKVGTEGRTYNLEVSLPEYAAFSSRSDDRVLLQRMVEAYKGDMERAVDAAARVMREKGVSV